MPSGRAIIAWLVTALTVALPMTIGPPTLARIEGVIKTLFPQITLVWDPVEAYLKIANYWLPLDAFFWMAAAFIVFAWAYICVKIAIKLIPFIG